MSYTRVIPRDLFNEGNLLKCLGALYIELEKMGMEDALVHTYPSMGFSIELNEATGGLTVNNVNLRVRDEFVYLERPLNSREAYPLYLYAEGSDDGDEEILVFNDDGTFSEDMIEFLERKPIT